MEQNTLSLSDPNGRVYLVDLDKIEAPAGRIHEFDTKCVLVVAKKKDNGWEVIDMVEIAGYKVRVGSYFSSWKDEPNDDGSHQHRAKQLGATHYGVIHPELPELAGWLAGNLKPTEEKFF